MKRNLFIIIFVLFLIRCNSADNDTINVNVNDDNILKSVAHLCINANDVNGWNFVCDTCQPYIKEDLNGHMNGGADQYLENGLVEYSFYNMADSSNDTVEIYVCHMGTSKNSATIFNQAKGDMTDSLSLKNYDGSTAVIGVFGLESVYELHAKLECFYFKLTFINIANNSEAIKVSETFLDLFQTKLR